jgi:hypothetical protein
MVFIVLAVAACGRPSSTATGNGSVASGWQVYPAAFAVNGDSGTGALVLLPRSNGCFAAFGRDSTGSGTISASWTATGDCTTTSAVPRTGRISSGDGPPSQDKVAVIAASSADGMSFVTFTRRTFPGDAFGYETTASIGTPGPEMRDVARFTGGGRSAHNGPDSVVAIERGYAAAGYVEAAPTVWTSPDGVAWRETKLPDAGQRTLNLVAGPQIAAGPRGQLVVVGGHQVDGNGSTSVDAWYSNDAGATWSRGTMPGITGSPIVRVIVYNGHEYVALGGVSGSTTASALVLRSVDGIAWSRDTSVDAAGVLAMPAATVLPDGSVLAVAPTGAHGPTPTDSNGKPRMAVNTQCAAAWIATNGSWRREDIGCHGVPDALATLSGGRVAAARGSNLFLRDSPAS